MTKKLWPAAAASAILLLITMKTNTLERMFVYYPMRELTDSPARLGLSYRDVAMAAEDGVKLHGWFVPAREARQTILIFHGNAGNIGHRVPWIGMLNGLKANVLIIDYRGYGRSEGEPFERGLYMDGMAAYAWWRREHGGTGAKLVLLGESLGGAVAADLALRQPVDGLILQSTFTSAWDMAKTIFPLGLLQPLTGVQYDSLEKVKSIRCPKLIVHGNRDEIVPFRLGKKLFDAAAPKKWFYEVEGAGHNDLVWVAGPEYTRRISEFLNGL